MLTTPLNGKKTHPLSKHALSVLASLPLHVHLVNPGVTNRLMREDLADIFNRGGVRFLEITAAGVLALKASK